MKKSSILFFICFSILSSDIEAQLVYQKKVYELPAPRFSHLYNTEKAVDSGYIVSGYSNTTANLAGFIFIAKIDDFGDTVWTRRYDGPEYEYGYIKNLYDSSYVVYGQLYSFNPCGDQEDIFLMKLKANGDTLWTRHYGTCYNDIPRDIIKGPNNGYYLFGSLNFGSSYSTSLLRLDAQGDTIWSRLLDISGAGKQQNFSCIASLDGGVIISGFLYDSSSAPNSSFLVKIDSSGIIQWDTYFDSPYHNQIYQIVSSSSGYYLIGPCNLGGTLGYGTMILKTDFNGNPMLGRMYDRLGVYSNGVTFSNDNSLFFAGIKQRGPIIAGQNNNDLISFKTDLTGNLLWAKKYVTNQLGFAAYSSISSLQSNDNGFLITTTSTTDPSYNTYNGFLVKVDSLGNGCSDSVLAINVVDITSMIITSDTISPVIGYYPVVVGYSPFNYYGSGINYTDLCNGYVGVEDEEIEIDAMLKIYPNPSHDQITLEFDLKMTEKTSLVITNILGQAIKNIDQKQFSTGKVKMEIDISTLPAGLYFVQLNNGKKYKCRKFIRE